MFCDYGSSWASTLKALTLCLVEISADDILGCYCFRRRGFVISYKLSVKETSCVKCRVLFSGRNSIGLSSAGFAHSVLSVK